MNKLQTWVGVGLVASALALSGCNGGGGSALTGNGDSSGGTAESRFKVAGPLDALQTPVSGLLDQVGGGLSGTPLAATVDCVNQAVVSDVLDIVDSLASAQQLAVQSSFDPQTLFNGVAGNIQGSLQQLAKDMPGLLLSLAGGGCVGGGVSGNPLAGTPLAPLGEQLLPVLTQIQSQIAAAQANGQDLDLTTLSALVTQLNNAFTAGVALIPDNAKTAPVFGGLVDTLSTAMNDLDQTMQAAGSYDGATTSLGISVTVSDLLVNVLTKVVPVTMIEQQAGQGPIISGQITAAVGQLSQQLYTALQPAATTLLDGVLNQQLAPVLDPVENTLLPAVLAPITDALANAAGSAGGSAQLTGTPLDAVLSPILGVLGSAGAGSLTGTPLDILLQPLAGAIQGGGVASCPLAGTPLDATCSIVEGLLTQITNGGISNLTQTLSSILQPLGLGGLLGNLQP